MCVCVNLNLKICGAESAGGVCVCEFEFEILRQAESAGTLESSPLVCVCVILNLEKLISAAAAAWQIQEHSVNLHNRHLLISQTGADSRTSCPRYGMSACPR